MKYGSLALLLSTLVLPHLSFADYVLHPSGPPLQLGDGTLVHCYADPAAPIETPLTVAPAEVPMECLCQPLAPGLDPSRVPYVQVIFSTKSDKTSMITDAQAACMQQNSVATVVNINASSCHYTR